MQFPKNKYNSSTCRCTSGHIHLSRGEARHCSELMLRQKSGEFHHYVVEKQYNMMIGKVKICAHKPDFTLYDEDDNIIQIEEYKGFATDVWKLKMKLFKALYPDIPYIVIYHKPTFKKRKWPKK